MQEELTKLKESKSSIRKVLQRKNTGLAMSTIYPNYYTYIKNMSDTKNPDETGLKDYVEDRCYSLTISVSKIRPYAFRNYTCLQQLYLNNTQVVTLMDLNAFYGISPKILVPSNLLSAYKSANNWSKIADRIEAYSSVKVDEMYLIQHVQDVQTVSWVGSKKISEIIKDFRN